MVETRSLPQSHSSELSKQLASPSHHWSRDTHSWFAHSSSSSWQNAGSRNKKQEDRNVLQIHVIITSVYMIIGP